MAFSYAQTVTPFVPGDRRLSVVDVTLDASSYSAGGFLPTAAQLGFVDHIDAILTAQVNSGTSGFAAAVNPSTGKIQVYKAPGSAAALTEVSAGDLSTSAKVRVVAIGV